MGSGWTMFSENYTLMLYQKELQLGPYFMKWHLVTDRGFIFYISNFAKYIKWPKLLGWSRCSRIFSTKSSCDFLEILKKILEIAIRFDCVCLNNTF